MEGSQGAPRASCRQPENMRSPHRQTWVGVRLQTFSLWGDSPITAALRHPDRLPTLSVFTVCGGWSQKPRAQLTFDGREAEKAGNDDLRLCSGSCWLKNPDCGLTTNTRIQVNTNFFLETTYAVRKPKLMQCLFSFGTSSKILIWICFAVRLTLCLSLVSAFLFYFIFPGKFY